LVEQDDPCRAAQYLRSIRRTPNHDADTAFSPGDVKY